MESLHFLLNAVETGSRQVVLQNESVFLESLCYLPHVAVPCVVGGVSPSLEASIGGSCSVSEGDTVCGSAVWVYGLNQLVVDFIAVKVYLLLLRLQRLLASLAKQMAFLWSRH